VTGVNVRLATAEDGDTLIRLITGLLTYEHLPAPDEVASARIRADLAAGERFTAWIAEVEGEAAGYALVFEAYSTLSGLPRLYLEDIFVLPEYRSHRAGYALIREVAREAERRNCTVLEWEVLDWNRLALDFYDRIGGEHQKEWLNYRIDREGIRRLLAED
jgi:GNAT superfamily N-acetyltransferase